MAYIFEEGENFVLDRKERNELQEKLTMINDLEKQLDGSFSKDFLKIAFELPDWVIEKYYKFA